ncbi:NAD(P)-binding domain-containing protein [Streptomyces sp. NBC_00555]|uniref:NAD(P)-binding domain-containing protein n=1 Tax=Streptomyces sp. NBC_00555 TaxID=2903662 RepID=UPI00224F2B54|nr:NAD(P)-binding domain-containing protein [Streptomyces sp. NBC_00555]MCX5013440.1 NAD(P)-binding domain-containing protein [Streptomyces sp. NBC_00555]
MDDLVVVGAGPYGLSIAAHAAGAGLDVRLLGRPMASWRDHMPDGMYLKSEPWASNLSAPDGRYTLADFCQTRGLVAEHGTPLPIGTFSEYGMWFARHAAPEVEEVTVTEVTPQGEGFRVHTAEGPPLLTRTVALAVGVMPFAHHPPVLRDLPPGHYSHSSGHRDLTRFAGREVAVLGAGQAALETAALLAEQGARPCLVARRSRLNWNAVPQPLNRPAPRALRDPHSGLGTGWRSWVWSELPWAVRRLPAASRERIAATALGPAGAWWLRDRFERRVPVLLGHHLHRAVAVGERTRLGLTTRAGESVVLDTAHVIAATGFTPDLDRLELLDAGLRAALETVGDSGTPELSPGFESSWPGLFFAGLLTAPSFGPSMRFVHGAGFTAGRLVRGVRKRLGARGPLPGSTGEARDSPGLRPGGPPGAAAGHPKTYLR